MLFTPIDNYIIYVYVYNLSILNSVSPWCVEKSDQALVLVDKFLGVIVAHVVHVAVCHVDLKRWPSRVSPRGISIAYFI